MQLFSWKQGSSRIANVSSMCVFEKNLGRMISRTVCLFRIAPTVNFHLFLRESLCPERWWYRDE